MGTLIGVVGEYTIVGEKRAHIEGIVKSTLLISWEVLYNVDSLPINSGTLVAEVIELYVSE